ncbi:uncharacterized protein LOC108916530 [Anoplophora glabripennis]|nr:uncharacterized protein LOC108916530 [Anoplophora glabripennis]
MIKAEVKASMKNHNYNIEISFDLEEGVKDAYCTCPRGTVSCHHMAAVLYYAHYNISVTDMQCQWSVPRAKRHHEDNIVKLKDVHQLKKPYKAVERCATENEIAQLRNDLGNTNVVGFAWLLRPEVTHEATLIIPDVEAVLQSAEYQTIKGGLFLKSVQYHKKSFVPLKKLHVGSILTTTGI